MNVTLLGSAVASLRECVAICAQIGGTPLCPTPSLDLSSFEEQVWLGMRKNGWSNNDDEGFTHCVDNSTPDFASRDAVLARVHDSSDAGFGGCSIALRGKMYETACNHHLPFMYNQRRCACVAGPNVVPADEIAWLDAWTNADLAYRRSFIGPSIVYGFILYVVPWLIYYLVSLRKRSGRRDLGAG